MSKLIPFLVAGVGASSVSVGGVFMLKKTVGSEEGAAKGAKESSTQNTSKDLEFDSLANFEQKGGSCVKELFGKEMNLSTTTATPNTVDYSSIATDLNLTSAADKAKNQSCLIINYEKKGGTDKGTGTFTWTWAFANENKGFVVFGLAKIPTPQSSEKKMTIEGGVYLLSKDGSSDWKVTKKKTVADTDGKEINKTKFTTEKHFPKPATDLQTAIQSYWGFLSSEEDLENICTEGTSCPTTPFNSNGKYKEQWMGKGQNSGGKKPYEWSVDMDWFKGIFGDSENKLKGHLDTLNVSGQGTKQTTTPA